MLWLEAAGIPRAGLTRMEKYGGGLVPRFQLHQRNPFYQSLRPSLPEGCWGQGNQGNNSALCHFSVIVNLLQCTVCGWGNGGTELRLCGCSWGTPQPHKAKGEASAPPGPYSHGTVLGCGECCRNRCLCVPYFHTCERGITIS